MSLVEYDGETVLLKVRVRLDQMDRLATIRKTCAPEESWDKTVQDAIDIALDHYNSLLKEAMVERGIHATG
jgi:hypothetical protein